MRYATFFCFFLFVPLLALGQYQHIPLDTLLKRTDVVVSGHVIEQECFYSSIGTILTESIIQVEATTDLEACFEGTIAIITYGGTIGDHSNSATHTRTLSIGHGGYFLLEHTESNNSLPKEKSFCVVNYIAETETTNGVLFRSMVETFSSEQEVVDSITLVKEEMINVMN